MLENALEVENPAPAAPPSGFWYFFVSSILSYIYTYVGLIMKYFLKGNSS